MFWLLVQKTEYWECVVNNSKVHDFISRLITISNDRSEKRFNDFTAQSLSESAHQNEEKLFPKSSWCMIKYYK